MSVTGYAPDICEVSYSCLIGIVAIVVLGYHFIRFERERPWYLHNQYRLRGFDVLSFTGKLLWKIVISLVPFGDAIPE